MISRLSISGKLEKLKEYLQYLKGYQRHTIAEIKKNHTLQGAVLHYLQLSIECVIDIGEIIISEQRFRKPQEAREVLKILAEQNIIPKDFAEEFSKVASLRNILVHEYTAIDLVKVYQHLKNDLKDFDFYANVLLNFLKRNDSLLNFNRSSLLTVKIASRFTIHSISYIMLFYVNRFFQDFPISRSPRG